MTGVAPRQKQRRWSFSERQIGDACASIRIFVFFSILNLEAFDQLCPTAPNTHAEAGAPLFSKGTGTVFVRYHGTVK